MIDKLGGEMKMALRLRSPMKMVEVDRFDWPVRLSLRSYGVRIGLQCSDPMTLERLERHLPPDWEPSRSSLVDRLYSVRLGREGSRQVSRLYVDHELRLRTTRREEILESFEIDAQHYVAEYAPQLAFIHAGAVAINGVAVLIPGRSYSGKSTLVTALLRAGAHYYSDEYAVLDRAGRVRPYPRLISLREGGLQVRHHLSAFGAKSGRRSLPVGLVIVSRYRPGARWRPRALSAGEGFLALLDNAVSIRRNPGVVIPALQGAATGARFLKGWRGEAGEVVEYIFKALDAMALTRM